MRLSFDLDGVITNLERSFFKKLDAQGIDHLPTRLQYYASRSLLHHPGCFMTGSDKGFIITARKPESVSVTKLWLAKHHINLPVYFVDPNGDIPWESSYQRASYLAAERKAEAIQRLGTDIHFDNNPFIVEYLQATLPSLKVVLIQGKRGAYDRPLRSA